MTSACDPRSNGREFSPELRNVVRPPRVSPSSLAALSQAVAGFHQGKSEQILAAPVVRVFRVFVIGRKASAPDRVCRSVEPLAYAVRANASVLSWSMTSEKAAFEETLGIETLDGLCVGVVH